MARAIGTSQSCRRLISAMRGSRMAPSGGRDARRVHVVDSHLPVHRHEAAIRTVLQEHGSREGEALAAYQSLVEECDDPPVRHLAKLIMEDERRHHAYISEMLHR